MKKLFLTILLALVSVSLFATSKMETVVVDGLERNYLVVTPSQPTSGTRPMLMVLHGVSGVAEEYAEMFNAQAISDLHDAVLVFPQALPEQDSENLKAVDNMKKLGVMPAELELTNPWGAGVRISAATIKEMAGSASAFLSLLIPNIMKKGYGELNESLDDVKFLNTVITNVKKSYGVNDEVYMAGASMGGAMAFKYAYGKDSQVKKICTINGFVGAGVDTTGKAVNVPVLMFNSQADAVVKYDGGMFNGSIDVLMNVVSTQNGCSCAILEEEVEDVKNDGNRVVKLSFDCDASKKVTAFVSTNAAHTQILNAKENDIDFILEMEKFFFGTANAGVEDCVTESLSVYPTMVADRLYCGQSGRCEVSDWLGRVVLVSEVVDGQVDLSELSAGGYIFTLKTANGALRAKIVKK